MPTAAQMIKAFQDATLKPAEEDNADEDATPPPLLTRIRSSMLWKDTTATGRQFLISIALLIYFAYMVLRDSINDIDKRARISAVYNIFAYAMLFPSIWIVPRMLESLHPGGQGNPALDTKDIDPGMRMVFYPAVIGWTLLGVWITTLKIRLSLLKEKKLSQ